MPLRGYLGYTGKHMGSKAIHWEHGKKNKKIKVFQLPIGQFRDELTCWVEHPWSGQ